jgi:uncharacterized protein GlcG (DUF336 family)
MIIMRTAICAIAAVSLASTATKADGLINTKRLSATLAGALVKGAVDACEQKHYHVGAVVLDYSGVQQAALRGDDASAQNVLNAFDKAYTAVTFGLDTAELVERSKTSAVSSAFAKVPHLLLNAGGVVIKAGEDVIGAIGVSGAPGGDNDVVCAKTAIENIKDRMR